MEAVSILLRTFGYMIGMLVAMIVIAIVYMNLWAKKRTTNMIYAVFLEQRRIYSKLLPIRIDKVVMGRGENKEEYLLDTDRQFWAMWPSGLPQALQIPVRAHLYIRNCPEPLDPSNPEAKMSSRSLHMMNDEALLRSTWKDARDAAGAGPISSKGSKLALILIFANVAIAILTVYFVMQIKTLLGG